MSLYRGPLATRQRRGRKDDSRSFRSRSSHAIFHPPTPFLSSFLADIRRGRASRLRDDEGSRTAGACPSFKTRGWPVRVPMFCVLFTILLVFFFYFVSTSQTSRYRSRNRVSRGKRKEARQTISNRSRAERIACPEILFAILRKGKGRGNYTSSC